MGELARAELCFGERQPRFQVLSEWLPSCSSLYRWRPAQSVDQAEDAVEDRPRQTSLGHLEDGIAGVFDQPCAGLDQAFPQRGQ